MLKRIPVLLVGLLAVLGTARTQPGVPNFFARRDYTGLYANWQQVADTNRDGIPDLIISFQGYIEVLFGNGDGTFREGPSTLTAALFSYAFVIADLNGDGNPDLIESAQLRGGSPPYGIV